jgi:hypothetical protein
MYPSNLLRITDITVFAILFYLGLMSYIDNPNIFDVLNTIAVLYVLVRRQDINTLTLVAILIPMHLFNGIVFFHYEQVNGYVFYAAQMASHAVAVILICFRPLVVSRVGPPALRGNKNLAVTQQDLLMGFVLTIQAIFQGLALLEHVSRHFADIGLGNVLDAQWWFENSRLIYNHYETGQFMFTVTALIILYFMTFDASKIERNKRKSDQVQKQ